MKKSIRDLTNIEGKRALVRVDINVPLDENRNVTDDTRIRAILPTIKLLKISGLKKLLPPLMFSEVPSLPSTV